MSNGKKRTKRTKGTKRTKRFLDTIETINEKDMVRDAKTGKEMSYKQYRKLEDKQDIDEDKKEFPRLAKKGYFGELPKKNRFGKQVQQREDKSVFDYQTKGKPIKKIVGKIKRAMGMSGLKEGGVVGNQKKLDMNKDGKLTKVDFQMLGNKSKPFKGKIDTDKEKLVSENGKTMVVQKAKGGSIQVSGTNFSGVY
tara:strand:+ start:547 stop:1131 length:585 start_codon:yes stop_codon:yes gene_type:complete